MSWQWGWEALAAIGTLSLALATALALLGGRIWGWIAGPRLKVIFKQKTPHCIVTRISDGATPHGVETYYVRFVLMNRGLHQADEVEVLLEQAWKKTEGQYQPKDNFVPLHLRWSVRPGEDKAYYPRISRGLPRHWNLCHIVDPKQRNNLPFEDPSDVQTDPHLGDAIQMHEGINKGRDEELVMSFDTVERYNNLSHLCLEGEYLVRIAYASDQAKARKTYFHMLLDKVEEDPLVPNTPVESDADSAAEFWGYRFQVRLIRNKRKVRRMLKRASRWSLLLKRYLDWVESTSRPAPD